MAVPRTLLLGLIAVAIGSAHGQIIGDRLDTITRIMVETREDCRYVKNLSPHEGEYSIREKIIPDFQRVGNNEIANLPNSSGFFLQTKANRDKLIMTVDAIIMTNTECLNTLNDRHAQLPENANLVRILIDALGVLVPDVIGPMQDKLNKWSSLLEILTIPQVLRDTRTSLLNSLNDSITGVCPYKRQVVGDTLTSFQNLLTRVSNEAGKVTASTCIGLAGCAPLITLASQVKANAVACLTGTTPPGPNNQKLP